MEWAWASLFSENPIAIPKTRWVIDMIMIMI
jgi:hypothetical protein